MGKSNVCVMTRSDNGVNGLF